MVVMAKSSKRIDKSPEPKSVSPDPDATMRVGEARIAVWFLTEDKQETTVCLSSNI